MTTIHHLPARAFLGLALLSLLGGAAAAQDRTYMLIQGIPGESGDPNHRDWIDLYGLDHLTERPVTVGGGSQNPGQVQFSDIAVLKGTDRSTPELHDAMVRGVNLGDVVIEVCREGGPAQECYYRLELTSVLVTSLGLAGSACIDPATSCTPSQTESVEINFREIRWIYTPYVNGSPQQPIERCWDAVLNTDCP